MFVLKKSEKIVEKSYLEPNNVQEAFWYLVDKLIINNLHK
jgi:hypothetical protein